MIKRQPGPHGWSGHAPDTLFRADSDDGRLSLTIDAQLEVDPDDGDVMRWVRPPVYVLSIVDNVAEAGGTSEHATIEEAMARAASETRLADLEWKPK